MGFANALHILQIGDMADYDASISYSHVQDKPAVAAAHRLASDGVLADLPAWLNGFRPEQA